MAFSEAALLKSPVSVISESAATWVDAYAFLACIKDDAFQFSASPQTLSNLDPLGHQRFQISMTLAGKFFYFVIVLLLLLRTEPWWWG